MEKKKCPGQGTGHRTNRAAMPFQAPYLQKLLQSSPNSVFKEQIKSGFNLQPHPLQVGGRG